MTRSSSFGHAELGRARLDATRCRRRWHRGSARARFRARPPSPAVERAAAETAGRPPTPTAAVVETVGHPVQRLDGQRHLVPHAVLGVHERRSGRRVTPRDDRRSPRRGGGSARRRSRPGEQDAQMPHPTQVVTPAGTQRVHDDAGVPAIGAPACPGPPRCTRPRSRSARDRGAASWRPRVARHRRSPCT